MREPFYVVWADYYNPVRDCYVEKMLGCYRSQYRAQKMVEVLREQAQCYGDVFYCVREEFFCDDTEE